jgi:hypothetical protein
MSEHDQQSGGGLPAAGPAMNSWQRAWHISLRVVGWGLIAVDLAILALFFLGSHVGPEAEKGAVGVFAEPSEVVARLHASENSAGVFLLIVTIWACSQFMFLKKESEGVRAVLGLVLGGLIVIGLVGHMFPPETLWGWVLAALPALLVVHHGLYLGRIKPRFIPDEVRQHPEQVGLDRYNLKDLVEANDRYFSASNIALRYGLPAVALFAIGATVFHGLDPTTRWALNKILLEQSDGASKLWITYPTLEAARFGAAGAYVYVLLYLGQRGFRHDISSGSALWCAVTLGLGPILAAVFSKIWLGDPSATAVAPQAGWATQALYFAVGLSPRHLAQQVAALVQRLGADPSKAVRERAIPLATLRGITPQIEERLSEEGIYDAVGMAMTDPMRLQRNTNFDKHQILGWVDAALLVHALPESWQELEKKGIRGARDLIWYTRNPKGSEAEGFKELAHDVLNEKLLWDVAWRLSQDAQVQRISILYQLIHEQVAPVETSPRDFAERPVSAVARVHAEPEPLRTDATGAP